MQMARLPQGKETMMKRPTKTLIGVARAVTAVLAVALSASGANAGGKGSNQVREIKVSQSGNQTTITVVGSERPTFTAFKLNTPKRLVVDLADSRVRGVPSVVDASTSLVSGVAVSQYTSGGVPVSRVMVNFREDAAYRVRARGNDLVITLTGSPGGANDVPAAAGDGAGEEIARAQAETAAARQELSKAKEEAESAGAKLAEVTAQLDSLKEQAAGYKQQAAEAQEQAEEARKVLEKVRAEAAAKEQSHVQTTAAAEKRAAEQVRKLLDEIKRAEAQAEAEQAKRARLERRLGELRGELADADRAKVVADKARQKAEAEADELKVRARSATATAAEAKQKAAEALEEQKSAAAAYQKAAEGQKAALLAELRQRERETVEAKRRLAVALENKDRSDEQLTSALMALNDASGEADKAAKTRNRVEASNRKELARAEKERLAAEQAAAKALAQAEQAAAAKQQAEQEMAKIRAEAARKADLAEQRADEAVNRAKKKLEEAEQSRESAEKKAHGAQSHARDLEQKLAAYKERADGAEARALALAGELEEYKTRAGRSGAQAESYAKQVNDLKGKAKSSEDKAAALAQQIEEIKAEAARTDARAAGYARELEELKSATGRSEKKSKAYARKVEQLEAKISGAEKRSADYEKKLAELARAGRRAEERVAEYELQLARARSEAERSESKVASYAAELEQVKEEAAKAQRSARRAEREAKKARAAQSRASKAYKRAAESEQAELLAVLKKRERETAEAKQRLEQAKQTIAEQEARLAELNESVAKQTAAAEAAEKKAAAAEAAENKAAALAAAQPPAPDREEPADLEPNRKPTQEELRLQRLAEMSGKTGELADTGAAASEKETETGDMPMVTDIEFRSDGGTQKVVIHLSDEIEYSKTTDSNGSSTVVLRGVGLGPMLERTLDVTDFGGAIERISSFKEGDGVQIDVELGRLARNEVTRKGKNLEWVFESAKLDEKGKRGAEAQTLARGTESRTVAREDDAAYEYPMDRTAAYAVQLKGQGGAKKKRYTGRRIDLDFKDADIHNILRLLADVGQVNIVTADDVSGTVTIRMRNVAWDHALDVILQAKHLGMVREGNLIRVAPLATLEKEREMEIARRKQNQALEPLETRLIPVSYAQAEELKPRAVDLLSDRGKLSVDARTNVIIARDVAGSLDQIEALIRNLDTQTPQVLIEGRIVEASSNYAREIGIQWGGDFSASTATANPTGLAFPSTVGVAGGATDSQTPTMGLSPVAGARPNPNFAVNLPASVGTGSGGALGITLGSITNNANLNFRLSALEEEGTLKILSSPKILTLDNREAHIEQGTLIPYSRISAQGIQTSFKEAKLNLTVTPHVTADGSVLLKLMMTRDEPDFNNKGARGDPTILKREAQTELLVSDGHTAVIGGIFTRNHGTSFRKVPFFGDIPILGWLFKSRIDSDRRSEMLIFITPRIVNRAESIGQ